MSGKDKEELEEKELIYMVTRRRDFEKEVGKAERDGQVGCTTILAYRTLWAYQVA